MTTHTPLNLLLLFFALLASVAVLLSTATYYSNHNLPNTSAGQDLGKGASPAGYSRKAVHTWQPMKRPGTSSDQSKGIDQSTGTDDTSSSSTSAVADSSYVAVFNITDSNATTLLSAHAVIETHVDDGLVYVTVSDYFTNLTAGGVADLLAIGVLIPYPLGTL